MSIRFVIQQNVLRLLVILFLIIVLKVDITRVSWTEFEAEVQKILNGLKIEC
jgi:hypothetical protein